MKFRKTYPVSPPRSDVDYCGKNKFDAGNSPINYLQNVTKITCCCLAAMDNTGFFTIFFPLTCLITCCSTGTDLNITLIIIHINNIIIIVTVTMQQVIYFATLTTPINLRRGYNMDHTFHQQLNNSTTVDRKGSKPEAITFPHIFGIEYI